MSKNIFNTQLILQNVRKLSSGLPELPKCDFAPKKYQGPSMESLKKIRAKHLPTVLRTYYSEPFPLHQGYMQWLFDINGRRYLDMFGGICTVSVGHCHPKITACVDEQMKTLGHCSNVYYHPKIHEYVQKLTDKFPGNLKVVYLVNSGSEANDLAVLLARAYTRNFDVISLMNGYHGMSYLTMSLSNTAGFKYAVPALNGVHQAMNADVFRGIWGGRRCRDSVVQTSRSCNCSPNTCEASDKYSEQMQLLFSHCLKQGGVAAFFAESIQGIGGTVQYPRGFLKAVYQLVREYGGLYVADEVQTGFGRTGDHYWGFQMHDIQPDIVTMAKGIGNGFPLGAVVTTPEIAEALNKGNWFNTFGGNPVACAAGQAVLDIIDEENYQENSKIVGTYLLNKLAGLRDLYPIIGDVRGKGLMIGMEMVAEPNTTKPLPLNEFLKIWEACRHMGLIVGRGGNNGNVFRIKPPMCVTKDDADFTVEVLDKAIELYMDSKSKN